MAKATHPSLFLIYFISANNVSAVLGSLTLANQQVDCRVLQKGCSCFVPDNLINHASVAMDLYYQSKGRNHWNCYFGNSGLVVLTDPSYGSCIYG
ncbi:glucan endo-1,3-beta-D-glucosidase isoform X3 [Olea europaea var. sylvestris]|uniref:glucan endo-1,3-beta-D-glucosidase isoform X3 n=1 Tax=Olea europaea var. sylvestris TaxID=158386 RepID=UPI000C1D7064|nr:glucan endo-1,3-beta-D-glucosidase isoform X3 [Olea europaea var. sylvestris]